MSNLIVYGYDNVQNAVIDVVTKKMDLTIPVDGGPTELNHINIAAYTLLEEALFELKPNEIQFLGGLTKTNMVSARQRAWLKNLLKKYLNIDIDAPRVCNDYEVIDLEAA